MIKTKFREPTGDIIENINIEEIRKYILDEFITYWRQGSGDGFIDYCENDINKYTMMIGPNENYGIYLRYLDNTMHETWLSLQNENELSEVVETADEIYASKGLFLPVQIAWEGIKEFLETGKRSEKINWVNPNIIPEDGNY